MHILSLLLLCIYTPSVFSAASSRTNRRRNRNNTMSIQGYGKYIAQAERQQKERQKIIDCIKKHEAKPCSNLAEFSDLKEHYIELLTQERNHIQQQRLQDLITQCNTRMNIMLDIEAAEMNGGQNPQGVISTAAIQEMHWHALRDTYLSNTEHYRYYAEQARLAGERYKTCIIKQDIVRLLNQDTVSADEYNNLYEQAETHFGEQAEEILAQLPEAKKIAMRSIQTTIATGITPQQSNKKIIRGINPNRAGQNKLIKMRKQAEELFNAKHLTPKIRAAKLATIHKEIARAAFGSEKQQASEAAQHFDRMHRQAALAEKASLLEASASTEDEHRKLCEVLAELRDTYAIIDPQYEETNYQISLTERQLWYLLGDIDRLRQANLHDTDAARICSTDILIDRLEKENVLLELVNAHAPFNQQRAAYYELLNTYNINEPEYQMYETKIQQLDLMIEIDQITQCDATEMNDLTYFAEHVRLRTQLLHMYEPGTVEYLSAQQGLEMHQALQNYTEAYVSAQEQIHQPITEQNVMFLHALIKDLYTYAQFINKEHTTIIPTEWMENKLIEYAQHITHYEAISDLKNAEEAPGDSRLKQQELLREIVNSPLTEHSARKEYLIKLIGLTDDVTSKLRIIRDELLQLGTLDTDEQIQWNHELAMLNVTRKIRNLREQLKTANIHDQISINQELAACYAQRKTLLNK